MDINYFYNQFKWKNNFRYKSRKADIPIFGNWVIIAERREYLKLASSLEVCCGRGITQVQRITKNVLETISKNWGGD